MSWISTNNLRRFADKLFHGKLSFGGSVTHNGATTFNGGVKVNTTKAEFAAPVSFTGTTTYKGNEIATVNNINEITSTTIKTNLASTSSASLGNGGNLTPGVTGILSVANGGTGQSNLDKVNVGGAYALNPWNGGSPTTANVTFADAKVRYYLATLGMTTGKPPGNGKILHLPWNNGSHDSQLFIGNGGTVATRYQNGSADWSESTGWKTLAFAADVPKNNGTGATGTWPINISGNALKDSKGNKIVDTYMKKEIDSDLNMGDHAIYIGDSSIDGGTGDFIIQTTGGVEIITGGDNRYLSVNSDAVATQNYVKANYVPLSNGHISINGSELWIE